MKPAWLLSAALLLAACSPQIYPLYLEMRQPSPSGVDLTRKSLSVVYLDGTNTVDSLFDRAAASALARELEADYFDGREEVGIYHIPSPDSVSLSLMHSLVMDTGADVVFLLSSHLGEATLDPDRPVTGATSVDSAFVSKVNLPVKTSLRVYDSMGEDRVHAFNGSATLVDEVFSNGMLTQDARRAAAYRQGDRQGEQVGMRISKRFLSQWKTERYSFYYFDGWGAEPWIEALEDLGNGEVGKAMDKWMNQIKNADPMRQACAAYNLAQALYLLEDYEMSARWLQTAGKWEDLSLAPGLQKRLDAHLEKLRK